MYLCQLCNDKPFTVLNAVCKHEQISFRCHPCCNCSHIICNECRSVITGTFNLQIIGDLPIAKCGKCHPDYYYVRRLIEYGISFGLGASLVSIIVIGWQ